MPDLGSKLGEVQRSFHFCPKFPVPGDSGKTAETHNSFRMSSQVTNMDLRVRPGNKATAFSVEEPIISLPEEGQIISFRFVVHAESITLMALRIRSEGWSCEPAFPLRYSAASTGRYAVKTIPEVEHWRSVSPLRQCFRSLCFVYTRGFLDKNGMTVVPHPPSPPHHYPDLAPCDIFLLPGLESALKEERKYDDNRNSITVAGYICRVQNAGLLQMCSTIARTLALLCQVARELLARGQQTHTHTHIYITEFFDHTSYQIKILEEVTAGSETDCLFWSIINTRTQRLVWERVKYKRA